MSLSPMQITERMVDLAARITPGPWKVRKPPAGSSSSHPGFVEAPYPGRAYAIEILGEDAHDYPNREGDMEFIAFVGSEAETIAKLARFGATLLTLIAQGEITLKSKGGSEFRAQTTGPI